MKILFNGDSNMAGAELTSPDLGMANILGKIFNARHLFNLATDGASNDLIYDSTLKFLENNNNLRPDLVVIGWSEPARLQWFLTDAWGKSRLWEINHLGVGIPVPDQYQARYNQWLNYAKHDGAWHMALSSYWHNKIYNLHGILKQLEIPHLFFNAFTGFRLQNNQEYKLDWDDSFYHPYDDSKTYVNTSLGNNYLEITPGLMHFPAQAHDEWATTLHNYMLGKPCYAFVCKR
jgi:hypothetical protein